MSVTGAVIITGMLVGLMVMLYVVKILPVSSLKETAETSEEANGYPDLYPCVDK
jgi:hypothetical protein